MLDQEQIQYLERHRVAVLATAGSETQPHAVPVCFAMVGDALYIALDAKPKRVPVERLRRVRDIQANPRVCLLIQDYDEDWTRLRWLQVRGAASVVRDGEEHARAILRLLERYPQYNTMALERAPLMRITPLAAVAWQWTSE